MGDILEQLTAIKKNNSWPVFQEQLAAIVEGIMQQISHLSDRVSTLEDYIIRNGGTFQAPPIPAINTPEIRHTFGIPIDEPIGALQN